MAKQKNSSKHPAKSANSKSQNFTSTRFFQIVLTLSLLFFLFIVSALIAYQTGKSKQPNVQQVQQDDSSSSEGEFCGGFAGVACPEGYTCKLDSNYPDAGGVCLKN